MGVAMGLICDVTRKRTGRHWAGPGDVDVGGGASQSTKTSRQRAARHTSREPSFPAAVLLLAPHEPPCWGRAARGPWGSSRCCCCWRASRCSWPPSSPNCCRASRSRSVTITITITITIIIIIIIIIIIMIIIIIISVIIISVIILISVIIIISISIISIIMTIKY